MPRRRIEVSPMRTRLPLVRASHVHPTAVQVYNRFYDTVVRPFMSDERKRARMVPCALGRRDVIDVGLMPLSMRYSQAWVCDQCASEEPPDGMTSQQWYESRVRTTELDATYLDDPWAEERGDGGS